MRKLLCDAAEALWKLLSAPLRQLITEAVSDALDCRIASGVPKWTPREEPIVSWGAPDAPRTSDCYIIRLSR